MRALSFRAVINHPGHFHVRAHKSRSKVFLLLSDIEPALTG